MDGFIFVGTNFRGLNKNDTFVFSFIMNTENYHFIGTGIRGSDPQQKPRKIGTPQNLSHPQYQVAINFQMPSICSQGHSIE